MTSEALLTLNTKSGEFVFLLIKLDIVIKSQKILQELKALLFNNVLLPKQNVTISSVCWKPSALLTISLRIICKCANAVYAALC